MGKTPQIKKLEGVIQGLVRELEQLTPHPDRISSPAVIQIGQTQIITGCFNGTLQMQAYLQDLPRRMGLERRLRAARRRLAYLRQCSASEVFALAAA